MTRATLWLAAVLLLAACSKQEAALPAPQEPDSGSIAYFCHMALPEHEGPKGQAFMKGQATPYWFASVGEAFVFLQTELFQPGDLRALYVNDMSRGDWAHPAVGAWVEIHQAVFVLGSDRQAAMGGNEPVPFGTRAAAEAFAKTNGGTVVDFGEAAKAMAVDQPSHDS
jgi:copper chaperone NosL